MSDPTPATPKRRRRAAAPRPPHQTTRSRGARPAPAADGPPAQTPAAAPLPPVTLTLGALDPAARLLEGVALPYLPSLPAVAYVRDALQQALAERKGVVLVGGMGSGKTMAVHRVLEAHEAAEAQKQALDAGYRPQRALRVDGVRSRDPLALYAIVWRRATGMELALRARHRTKPVEQVRDELVEMLRSLDVAVLVFDEAQQLTPEALTAIRDLLAVAEATDPARHLDTGTYRPAGLGVVLVGTDDLHTTIAASVELGHRWLAIRRVPAVPSAHVPQVYAAMLPALARAQATMGAQAWDELVAGWCWQGSDVPVRLIENHVREYVRLVYNHAASHGAAAGLTLATLPWDREIFRFAREQMPLTTALEPA